MLKLTDFYLFTHNKTIIFCNNFYVKDFEKALVVGENDSGKSLLCSTILGNYKNFKGEVDKTSFNSNVALIDFELNHFANFTLKKWLNYGLNKIQKSQLPKLTEITKLYSFFDIKIKHLSFSQCKLAEIVKATATNPSLILIDEVLSYFSEHKQMLALRILDIASKQGSSVLVFSKSSLPGFWDIYKIINGRIVKQ